MTWVYNITNSNAPTDAGEIIAVATVMTALALLIVILRIYVRWGILNVFGIDDGLVIFSWFMSFGFTVVTSIQTRYGLGLQNINDLPTANIQGFNKLQFAGAPFYILGILGFKLSLLFAYMRFMPQGPYRHATYVVIVLTTLFHLSFLITQINLCNPIQAQWDSSIPNYVCLQAVPVYTTMASLTIFFDIIVMALPFPVLLDLKMQDRKKIVILGLFGLGIFITIIQIIRIQTVRRLTNLTDSAPLITWSSVEANLGIIVASIPCLSPLIKYFRERPPDFHQPLRC
ncbi:hypothetical protein N0V93_004888 [Gnomoniopsis smithogilvyi]|uniref:Rhodopsin domain-containing protein n=1 Tax=Gnomoniopsis smithogilvyi TaxID=1191159 RepID=A0A9W8YRV6_9PEZI|nr:hypothetical protein N0V93_004888 [Gnomoniopsis smithogilvyi]